MCSLQPMLRSLRSTAKLEPRLVLPLTNEFGNRVHAAVYQARQLPESAPTPETGSPVTNDLFGLDFPTSPAIIPFRLADVTPEIICARLRSPPVQRSSRRRSDFRCAAIQSAVVRRAGCNQLRLDL